MEATKKQQLLKFATVSDGADKESRVSPWALSALFFCTGYHAISKRYLALAWSMGAPDALGTAASTGALVNAALCLGTLLFSGVLDYLGNYYWPMMGIMSSAAFLAAVALMLTAVWAVNDIKLQALVLLVLFGSAAVTPLRDAMTSQLVSSASQGSTFGQYRLYVVIGQMFVVLSTANLMGTFGPSSCLAVLAACLSLTFVLYGSTFSGAAGWFAAQRLAHTSSTGIPVGQHNKCVKGFDFAMVVSGLLGVGIASGVIEVLLLVRMYQLGVSVSLCGLAYAVALATELPVFYCERWIVKKCGGYEGAFVMSCVVMSVRLLLLAAYVVGDVGSPNLCVLFFTEALHGLSRAPVACTTAHLAGEVAPPHLKTTIQGVFNVAAGFGGTVFGCLLVKYGLVWVDIASLFAAVGLLALLSAGPIVCYKMGRDSDAGHSITLRKLVIVVRADPVCCGHSTEARNLAEAALKSGVEVHIVTWPLSVLERAGLPLKTGPEEPYSPGIFVHRPEVFGDDKVLDGRLIYAMTGKIVDIMAGDKQPPKSASGMNERDEFVDVIMTFYLVPHAQVVLQAAETLRTLRAAGAYNGRVVTIGKAVGSDITSQVAACLDTGDLGSANTIFSQYLQHDVLQAVSQYTKDFVLECCEEVDKRQHSELCKPLNERIEISYPPLDAVKYEPAATLDEATVAFSHKVCETYGVKYGNYLLYMSRVHHAKGVDDLVHAYQASSVRKANIPLLICGAGPFLKTVKELAEGDELIKVVGAIPEGDKVSLLHACAAYCLPSKPTPVFIETFGIAISEKMLAGGPGVVVSTLCGGIPEATGGETTSVVVEYGNVESIRAGLERAIFMPHTDRAVMAAKALEYSKRFDRHNIWDETVTSVKEHVKRAPALK